MLKTLSILAIASCATAIVPLAAFAQMADQGDAMGGGSMQKGSMSGGMGEKSEMMKKPMHHHMRSMHHKSMMKHKAMSGGGM